MKMNLLLLMGLIAVQVFTGSSHASTTMDRTVSPAPKMNITKDPGFSAEFVTIRAGTFQMGSPTSEVCRDGDELLHSVTFSKDFEIQTTEVTQAQWFSVVKSNNNARFNQKKFCPDDYIEIDGIGLCPNHPIDAASWIDADWFINVLNRSQNDYIYRLPTEAEWEYAARGGTQTAYFFGDDAAALGDYAWYDGNSGRQTHAVGSKIANQYGLYDMYGNVEEWVQDWYAKCYPSTSQLDPEGPIAGIYRVIRGGKWHEEAQVLRSAKRFYRKPYDIFHPPYEEGGFRLVRTAK